MLKRVLLFISLAAASAAAFWAYTCLPDGTRLGIKRGCAVGGGRGHLPGEVLDGDGLTVACGEGAYRIFEVQREGKRATDADAFLRGHPLPAGSRFGP